MDFIVDKFFEDFTNGWGFGVPRKIVFNTAKTKDMIPACWKPLKDEEDFQVGYKSICRTVGISPEDVTVELKDNFIIVKGETKYEDEKYSQYFEIPLSESLINDIEKIQYRAVNGLTYIYLYVRIEKKEKPNIEKI